MLRALGDERRFAGATITHHSGRAVLHDRHAGVGIGVVLAVDAGVQLETSLG
jgi:hypothetical protein